MWYGRDEPGGGGIRLSYTLDLITAAALAFSRSLVSARQRPDMDGGGRCGGMVSTDLVNSKGWVLSSRVSRSVLSLLLCGVSAARSNSRSLFRCWGVEMRRVALGWLAT